MTRLDTAPALEVPGVVRVLTADDVPGVNDAGVKHDEPLFPSEVMFHGHAVCWVLGETLEAARLGAERVEVDYEPLPSLVTLREAIAAESFQGARPTLRRGDPDAALASAAHVVEGEFEFGGQEHFYLETHASLAMVDEGGQVFVQSSTQHPSETQEIVAHVLGLRSHEVTVQCLRMGGGFGGKEMQPHGYAAIAALGATLTGRPVRLRLNRSQDITMSGKRHPFHASWTAGFDEDGHIVALRATLTSDGGWSLDLSEPVLARALCHVDNAYWIPDIEVHGRIAKTNKTSQTAFRGFGGPQGMLVIEDILGRMRAPARARLRRSCGAATSTSAGQTTPYGQPVRHAERLLRIWQAVEESARGDAGASGEIAEFNAAHRHTKRALAITPVKFGISFNLTAFNQAGALVHVYKDGSVLVNHGGTEMGQGLHTKMLQVAATALGRAARRACGWRRPAPTRCPTPRPRRPARVPTSTAGRSRTPASRSAAAWPRSRPAGSASTRPTCASPTARSPGSGSTTPCSTWPRSVHDAYHQRVQLSAAGFYRTEGLHWDASRMQGEPFKYFAYGVAASEVEVDGFTGAYRLRRVDIVHDVGDSLSPLVDIGQIEGGFVQGAGWLTLEELRWDDSDGPPAAGSPPRRPAPTSCPSFSEMPEVFNVTLLRAGHRGRRRLRLQGRRRAPADARLQRPRGAARRRPGRSGRRAQRRAGLPGHAGGRLLGGGGGPGRPAAPRPDSTARGRSPGREPGAGGRGLTWLPTSGPDRTG